MRKILYICVLLCSCNNVNQTFNCMSIKFSNALPVQFWVDGKETFNEKQENYIDKFCFNQQFKCGTDIRLRITDNAIRKLFLRGYAADGTMLLNLPFTRTQINNVIFQEKFTSSLDGWTGNAYGVAEKVNNWIWASGLIRSTVSDSIETHDTLVISKEVLSTGNPLPIGQHYLNIYYELGDSATDQQRITLQMFLINAGAIVKTINVDTFIGQSVEYTKQITNFPFSTSVAYDKVGFGFIYEADDLNITVAIGEIDINNLTGNYYDANFVGNDYDLCDKMLQLKVEAQNDFNTLDQFMQISGTDLINLSPLPAAVNLGILGGGHDNIVLKSLALEFIPADYTFDYILNSSQTDGQVTLNFYKNGVSVGSGTNAWSGFSGDITGHIDVTITDTPDEVRMTIKNNSSSVNIIKFQSIEPSSATYNVAGKSDFIEITSVVGQLQTIKYKSVENFAGLIWSEADSYMQLDVDARFYHTRPKDTVKAIDLSNSRVIGTASELKEQTNLQIYAQPPYMHRKTELALMHSVRGNVSINEQDITMEEAYATADLGDFNPFSTAECWLTNKTFIERNVI